MTPSKAKGTKWEGESVRFLSRWWPDIARRALGGRFDKGDIINGPEGFTLENKDRHPMNLPAALREAERESANAGTRFYAVLAKQRRGKLESGSTGRGLFVMRLEDAARLLVEHERMAEMLSEWGYRGDYWQEKSQ